MIYLASALQHAALWAGWVCFFLLLEVAFQLLEQSSHDWLPAHTAFGDPRAQRHVEEDCPTHEKDCQVNGW